MKNIVIIIAYAVVQFHSINTQINIKQISTDDKKPSGQFKIPTAFLLKDYLNHIFLFLLHSPYMHS